METKKEQLAQINSRIIHVYPKYFTRIEGYAVFPHLRLCGKWLQQTGFEAGHQVRIDYQPGRIVITIANELAS